MCQNTKEVATLALILSVKKLNFTQPSPSPSIFYIWLNIFTKQVFEQ